VSSIELSGASSTATRRRKDDALFVLLPLTLSLQKRAKIKPTLSRCALACGARVTLVAQAHARFQHIVADRFGTVDVATSRPISLLSHDITSDSLLTSSLELDGVSSTGTVNIHTLRFLGFAGTTQTDKNHSNAAEMCVFNISLLIVLEQSLLQRRDTPHFCPTISRTIRCLASSVARDGASSTAALNSHNFGMRTLSRYKPAKKLRFVVTCRAGELL